MRADRIIAFFTALAFLLGIQGGPAGAAELKVLSAAALNPVTNALFAEFERTTGHKLVVRAATGPILSKEIEAGAPFDVAILSLDVETLIKQGKNPRNHDCEGGPTGYGATHLDPLGDGWHQIWLQHEASRSAPAESEDPISSRLFDLQAARDLADIARA